MVENTSIKEAMRYARAAQQVTAVPSEVSCCSSTFCDSDIENIQLPGNSVDVIVSNWVINLSNDRDRVLRPGRRFAVPDVIVRGVAPAEVRRSMELRVGCIAGTLEEKEDTNKLERADFCEIAFGPERIYRLEDARALLASEGLDVDAIAPENQDKFMSALVRAVKPANASPCCAPGCCQ